VQPTKGCSTFSKCFTPLGLFPYPERFQIIPKNKETKICVIGHTHHPYLNTNINDGKNIYIDAGGWTAGRSDFVVITNEEVGICCYQR